MQPAFKDCRKWHQAVKRIPLNNYKIKETIFCNFPLSKSIREAAPLFLHRNAPSPSSLLWIIHHTQDQPRPSSSSYAIFIEFQPPPLRTSSSSQPSSPSITSTPKSNGSEVPKGCSGDYKRGEAATYCFLVQMDLETENRIAAILLKEAAELRRQAQQEGVLAYLQKPTHRGRPNSRFLTATVRGIQQANRAVEVNEMWRVRQKELELDDRLKGKSRDEGSHVKEGGDRETSRSRSKRRDSDASCSSSKRSYEDHHSMDDDGLKDEEIEKFLHSRAKRGRGSVGSRMDETGPYLPQSYGMQDDYEAQRRVVLGPEKPSSWKLSEPSEDESDNDEKKSSKKVSSGGSKKKHSKKHKSKEKLRDKKKKKKRQKH